MLYSGFAYSNYKFLYVASIQKSILELKVCQI